MIDIDIDGIKFIPIICGPTASGKSSLALDLCERLKGELISADSMQIYRGLDIGTAKATKEEQDKVPHHMIDIVEPGINYSSSDYIKDALSCCEEILSRGRVPVFCGGTGQYISALKDGIRYVDESIDESALYKEYNENGIDDIYLRLTLVGKEAASKIHKNNIRRVIRALSIYDNTGKTATEWNKESKSGPMYPYKIFMIDYEEDRALLYDRINKRVDIMADSGIIEEASWLLSLDVDRTSTCYQAIGYKEIFPYILGKKTLEECIYLLKLNSRHYAKRQLTWFRYMNEIIKLNREDENNVERIIELIT